MRIFFSLVGAAAIGHEKTNRSPSREGPLSLASFRPQLSCESICSPSIRAASARFQQVLFSRHFGCSLEHPSFFLADASQHLPMLRLRDRFKPCQTVCLTERWRPLTAGLVGPVDLILPYRFPPLLIYFFRRRFHHVRASCLLLWPSLEVLARHI